MMDRVLAVVCLLGLLAFVGWVNIRVMEPDLWMVSLVVMGIAISYFWQDLKAGGSHFEGEKDEKPES